MYIANNFSLGRQVHFQARKTDVNVAFIEENNNTGSNTLTQCFVLKVVGKVNMTAQQVW